MEVTSKEILLSNEAKLKWHNNMVEAHYSATTREMKMLVALAAHVDKNSDEFEYYTVSAKELGALMHLDQNGAYKVLQETAIKLFNRSIAFKTLEKTKDGKPKKVDLYHIFYRLTYDNDQSIIGYQFAPAVKPLLLQVKSAYVETSIDVIMQFRSAYSSRIYLHIVQWSKLGTYTTSIADLREQFELGKKYALYADFKRSVVEPSLAEINAFSQYNVTAEFIRNGRKYTHVRFNISRKKESTTIDTTATSSAVSKPRKQRKTSHTIQKPELTPAQIALCEEIMSFGINEKAAQKLVQGKPLEEIKVSINYAKNQYKAGKVENMGAYLRTAITNGYGVAEARAAEQEAAAAIAKEQERLAAMTPEQFEAYLKLEDDKKAAKEMAAAALAQKIAEDDNPIAADIEEQLRRAKAFKEKLKNPK